MSAQRDLVDAGLSNKRRRIEDRDSPSSSIPTQDPSMDSITAHPNQGLEVTGRSTIEAEEGDLIAIDGSNSSVSWPAFQLPVEIFVDIIQFLSREDVKNLRMVNKEFECKVSALYFSNVVVPFTAELYSSNHPLPPGTASNAEARVQASAKLSEGMRIFKSFGHHINRFALCLELEEDHLACPPIKTTQKVVPAFWGMYRWPKTSYTRYAEFEGIEETADEFASMKEALKCLSQVRELGLCCDPGLGYLTGPERNPIFNPGPHPVFRTWNQDHLMDDDPEPDSRHWQQIDRMGDQGDPSKPLKHRVLESMVMRAGMPAAQAQEAVNLLLDSEGITMSQLELDEFQAPRVKAADNDTYIAPGNDDEDYHDQPMVNDQLIANDEPMITDADLAASADDDKFLPAHMRFPLLPNMLSQPQKEMLLELEWAHRALIQSYVLAITDLGREGRFSHLTTLTIAKIPSSHLFIFQRHDLWHNLPSLKAVSFAVVPDWRSINKKPSNFIDSRAISPVESVQSAFDLLRDYVGVRPNIESLHFEWICGGEFAPGSNQRDRFVLPAPFCLPADMVEPDTPSTPNRLLAMPFVRRLSLKNCYAAPHVFMQVIRTMALANLDSLELVSVSLTGPPRRTQQDDLQTLLGIIAGVPPLLNLPMQPLVLQHPLQQHVLALITASQNQVNPPHVPGATWRLPRLFSWSGFIEHFTTGRRVQDEMSPHELDNGPPFYDPAQTAFLPGPSIAQERSTAAYNLKSITFKSCGYVSVKAPFINTVAIISPRGLFRRESARGESLRDSGLAPFLQVTTNALAAPITPELDVVDQRLLSGFYGMDIGWEGQVPDRVVAAAAADGGYCGTGRFSGVIGTPETKYASSHPDYIARH